MFNELTRECILTIVGTSTATLSAIFRKSIGRFLRFVLRFLRPKLRRLIRYLALVKISQCFPRHTIEHSRLLGERETLLARISELEGENEQIRREQAGENPELEEAILKLLEFTVTQPVWNESEAMQHFGWGAERLDFVRAKAIERQLLRYGRSALSLFALYAEIDKGANAQAFQSHALTRAGQDLLFRKGRLP